MAVYKIPLFPDENNENNSRKNLAHKSFSRLYAAENIKETIMQDIFQNVSVIRSTISNNLLLKILEK